MSIVINDKRFKKLIDYSEISHKVDELAQKITRDHAGRDLLIVGVLKGGIIFMSDLMRSLDIDPEIDFLQVSSYKDEMEAGELELISDVKTTLTNKNVLLVEDLIDTGKTLEFIRADILSKQPSSFKICTLIKKKNSSQASINIDYVGFEIGNEFIVGYGMDYAEKGRSLRDIYVIDP
ncbi:MAG: hypoxanthine phosphoribosyltransferase [Thermodesulfobacteriota bacterium]